jgi:hypothetical protein
MLDHPPGTNRPFMISLKAEEPANTPPVVRRERREKRQDGRAENGYRLMIMNRNV